jgi:exosortase/archaeosortase family protein
MTAGTAPHASALTRAQLFYGLFLLATLNGFVGIAVRTIEGVGWAAAAFDLFGISAILWVALAAGLKILGEDEGSAAPRRGDFVLAAALLFAALLPVAPASTAALTLAAFWAALTAAPGSPLRRAAIVFLAMTGAMLWGRLVLAGFSRPLLDLDAIFVAGTLGAEHQGNMIWSADGAMRLIVAPGCSSMQGLSLAIVFWATVNQYFRVPFGWKAVGYGLAAVAATVAVNVLRIGAMLRWPEHQQAIHHGWGMHIAMWTTLALVVAICLFGARREVFGPR